MMVVSTWKAKKKPSAAGLAGRDGQRVENELRALVLEGSAGG
jgi:hypothetical protein